MLACSTCLEDPNTMVMLQDIGKVLPISETKHLQDESNSGNKAASVVPESCQNHLFNSRNTLQLIGTTSIIPI